MVVDKDSILSLVKQKGPLVPNDIKRSLGGDSFLIGAILSELKSRKFLLMTAVKKGGSSFYYLPGQELQLEKCIEYLNEKDQQTVHRLSQEKIFNEADEELFTRVSLRNIPDFAKPFMMQTPAGEYRFWRYFLLSEQDAKQRVIDQVSEKKQPEPQQSPQPEQTPREQQPVQEEQPSQEEVSSQNVVEEKRPVQERQVTLSSPQLSSEDIESTPFYDSVVSFFKSNSITVQQQEQLGKDREYFFIISLPTAVGPLQLYAHARNKKKLNEGDVAPALLKAKLFDLPCLYLYDGEFTKKALTIIEEEYKGIILKEL